MKYVLEKDEYINENSICLGEKTLTFSAPIRTIETFGEASIPKIVINYYRNKAQTRDDPVPTNNVHCYNPNGILLWTLNDLIDEYNKKNSTNIWLNTFCTLIKKLDHNLLYVLDGGCYYYVNVQRDKIIYLEGTK